MSSESVPVTPIAPTALVEKIQSQPESIEFAEVIATIGAHFSYTPTDFSNGLSATAVKNLAGTNEGSCKIFAFAKLHQLTESETLACFGHYYRDDVLANPDGDDHQNIRQFMRDGWAGIQFSQPALVQK